MSLFLASIPFQSVIIRREYTRDLRDRRGEYLSGKAIAAFVRRGHMLGFQVVFDGFDEQDNPVPTGGAMFVLPIEALCWKPCEKLATDDVAPWDCLSDEFSVERLTLLHEMCCHVLPRRLPGRYLFTVQYGNSDLARDATQHKQHHVLRMDAGHFGCFPNNRLLMDDRAMFPATTERPDFVALTRSFSGE